MNGVDIWRIELGELQTLIIAIIALFIGGWVRQSIPMLSKLDMPNAVVGAPSWRAWSCWGSCTST